MVECGCYTTLTEHGERVMPNLYYPSQKRTSGHWYVTRDWGNSGATENLRTPSGREISSPKAETIIARCKVENLRIAHDYPQIFIVKDGVPRRLTESELIARG
jgi:hypothetical protein